MLTNEVFQSEQWIQEVFPDLCELKALFPLILFCAGSLPSLSEVTDQCLAEYLRELIHRYLDVSLHGSVLSQALPVNSSCHTLCLISLTLNLISLSSALQPENSQGSNLRQPRLSPIPQGSPYFVAQCLMSGKRCFAYCASVFSSFRQEDEPRAHYAILGGSRSPSIVFQHVYC